jgi:hypothetical protein
MNRRGPLSERYRPFGSCIHAPQEEIGRDQNDWSTKNAWPHARRGLHRRETVRHPVIVVKRTRNKPTVEGEAPTHAQRGEMKEDGQVG